MNEVAQILETYTVGALKQIAAARGENAKAGKAQLVPALAKVLWSPREIERVLETLTSAQHAALQHAKRYGGEGLYPELLEAHLEQDGIADGRKVVNVLMRLGLLVYERRGYGQWDLWPARSGYNYYYQLPTLRLAPPAAERITVPPDIGRFPLQSWDEPLDRVLDIPFSTLQRDLYQFLQYLRENKVKLLKSGLISKRDFTRLNRLMTEPEEMEKVYDFEGTFRLRFLHLLLAYTGLTEATDNELRPTAKAEGFFLQPELEQARTLLKAWVRVVEWNEFFDIPWIEPVSFETTSGDMPSHSRLPTARQDILDLLERERPHAAWFSLPSLIESMKRYKLGFLIPNRGSASSGYSFGSSSKETEALYSGFRPRGAKDYYERFSKQQHWALVEGGFIVASLQWALQWLGIVRLGVKGDTIAAFQVTEFGAAALGWTEGGALPAAAPARSLVVQPNFEIVAMLESAGFGLLAELDRFAERVKLDKAALYRLTRESVCHGLQAGLTIEQIEETLSQRSGMPLPQNVAFTLREWEELFNRIRIEPRVMLVEADTEGELDKRLEELKLTGARRVSPTAAVIDAAAARKLVAWGRGPQRRVAIHDYAQTTADTFRFTDAREIEVRPGLGSPLIEYRLARVAVPMKNGRFLLDPERVRAAVTGLGMDGVVRFLEEGSGKPLLADTRVTLEGWAGKFPALGVGKVTALTAPRADVLDTILRVPELAKHARRLAPTVALVPEKEAPELQKALAARGITVAPDGDLDAALARPADADEISLLFVRPKRRREIIDEAIAQKRKLLVGHQNWNSTRIVIHEVDPIKVLETGSNGTLIAYSHKEKYQMQFVIQQIQGIRMLEKPVEATPGK